MEETRQHGFIALGSNLGDRQHNIDRALTLLGRVPGLTVLATSQRWRSLPVGFDSDEAFVNMVAEVVWLGDLLALLIAAKGVEVTLGRQPSRGGYDDRPIDIDLLHFDGVTLETERLSLPHPGLCRRAFVLLPMLELAPELIVSGRKLTDWIARLPLADREACSPAYGA